ncbi:MAG: PEP-CTERM sorting domain-containing protein [Planctomycetes bacterium]|nr:PEP-CTERM sorting domain-containing protein [Planctomycetota bacterium]
MKDSQKATSTSFKTMQETAPFFPVRECYPNLFVRISCALLVCTAMATCHATAPELGTNYIIDTTGGSSNPIVHQQYFVGERELYGYDPHFMPNTVTFDPTNKPYMRVGTENGVDLISNSDFADGGYVQTLDASGNWIELSFVDDIQSAFGFWNGIYFAGTTADERVVFDDVGDAYMLVNAARPGSNLGRNLLLYSTDNASSWDTYILPTGMWATFEVPDSQSDNSGPPTILMSNAVAPGGGTPLSIVRPTKTGGGTLLDTAIATQLVSNPLARPGVFQSGLGNSTLTIGDLTHLVYLTLDPVTGGGTGQYAVTYDRSTGQTTAPVLLGVNGTGVPDEHNSPVITTDSQGYLNVILGGHHDQLFYTKSLTPNSTTGGWTTPVGFGPEKDPVTLGGSTYISAVMDQNDTLHVVTRNASDNYTFSLQYLRKTAGGVWEDLGPLVKPFKQLYSTWDQNLTIDEQGRLFLRYSYYGDQFDCEPADNNPGDCPEVEAYREKWPNETISLVPGSRPDYGFWNGLKAHDPVILMSDDAGDTWRIATTPDFVPPLLGDFDDDNDVDGFDFLTWQRDPNVGNLSDWESNFGTTGAATSASTVPEPATGLLLLVGGLGSLLPRRKR